jgi:hypothetical protein
MSSSPREAVRGDVGSGWVAFAGAYPIWSVIALTNGLVLWAVTAHGDEFDG